jgi:hypothetical protein
VIAGNIFWFATCNGLEASDKLPAMILLLEYYLCERPANENVNNEGSTNNEKNNFLFPFFVVAQRDFICIFTARDGRR